MRTGTELALRVPRVGFFTTPAFFGNWATNTSNQARVTINQTLIVALGRSFDDSNNTQPLALPPTPLLLRPMPPPPRRTPPLPLRPRRRRSKILARELTTSEPMAHDGPGRGGNIVPGLVFSRPRPFRMNT